MDFEKFVERMIMHFNTRMANDSIAYLFVADAPVDELWDIYLNSFPDGTNEIYKTCREYDCTSCRHFIKSFGNVVAINAEDNTIITLWDFDAGEFQPVVDALSTFVKKHKIVDMYLYHMRRVGISSNFGKDHESGEVTEYHHLYVDLPIKFINPNETRINEIKSELRDAKNVLKRSLKEINMDALDTVLELINSNCIYRGLEHRNAIMKFKEIKEEYDSIESEEIKDIYIWRMTAAVSPAISKIRNHSIGTLLVDISNGKDLEAAVNKYECVIMAPNNYKRPKAIYTKKMVDDARAKITELGYLDSLQRRFANIDDISINDVLFVNRNICKSSSNPVDIFSEMEASASINPKRFSRVQEVPLMYFVNKIIPRSKEIEVFMENKHTKNLVSMIAPSISRSNTLFKWDNPLSWAYTGNVASDIKQNVKNAGGDVNGVLRFSIQWNDSGSDNSDLDAHCIEPFGVEIFFASYSGDRLKSPSGGSLDIDITDPILQCPGIPAVENIVYKDKSKMKSGIYQFFVHQYSARNSQGFKAEIEMDGQIFEFQYDSPVLPDTRVYVADVILKNGKFEIIEKLKSKPAVRKVWGIQTNQFVPVKLISYSPNYFNKEKGLGHQHLFFFLDGCVNDENPNGFYNEFLKDELVQKHKRVFEALGNKCKVADADSENQLSGIGFSVVERASLIVKVKEEDTEKIMRISF